MSTSSLSASRSRIRRAVNFQTVSNIITFDLKHEEPHDDIAFELDIGSHPMSVRVFFVPKNFAPEKKGSEYEATHESGSSNSAGAESPALSKARSQFQSLSGLGPAGTGTAGVTFYANDTAQQRICDYRHILRVRGRSDTRPRSPGEINATDPLLTLASTRGKLYMAISSTEPIINQQLVCYLDPPHTTVPDHMDSFVSIWQVAQSYVVSSRNQAAVVERLRVKQHLMDDAGALRDETTGATPLHILCENAGDPALAKLLLGTHWRALGVELQDCKGETALLKLLQRPVVHNVDGPWHNRAHALLELLVRFGGASLCAQSGTTGDTPLHLCMRYHSYGGKLLPLLLQLGGGHATIQAVRNNRGVTAEGELSAPSAVEEEASAGAKACTDSMKANSSPSRAGRLAALQSFMKSGKDEALRLLQKCDKELLQEARPQNLAKMRGLPLYRGPTSDGGQVHHSATPEALRVPPPDLVDFADPMSASHNQYDDVKRPVIKAKLAKLVFEKYADKDGQYMSRNSLLTAVLSYDMIGLPENVLDSIIDSIGICSDGRVNLDEFTLVLLKLQSRG